MFLKYSVFLTALSTGCQKRRLHTELTEHSFGQSWPEGWNLGAMAEDCCSWYASRNTLEYSENSSLMTLVRKITELTKGLNKAGSAQTQLQHCGAALDFCHKAHRENTFWHSKSTVTNLAVQTASQTEAQVYCGSWQHTEECVNPSCDSFPWCHSPRILTKQSVQEIKQGSSAHQRCFTNGHLST